MIVFLILWLFLIGNGKCQFDEAEEEMQQERKAEELTLKLKLDQDAKAKAKQSIVRGVKREINDQEESTTPTDEENEIPNGPLMVGLDILGQTENDLETQTDRETEINTTSGDNTIPNDDTDYNTETEEDVNADSYTVTDPEDETTILENFTNTEEYTETTHVEISGFVYLRQEPECLNEGGNCGLYSTCPECMRAREGLCPRAEKKRGPYTYQETYDPRKDAAICCYGMPVKETRCWKMYGVCLELHEYCPKHRIFADATDCDKGMKCCMTRAKEHIHFIEY